MRDHLPRSTTVAPTASQASEPRLSNGSDSAPVEGKVPSVLPHDESLDLAVENDLAENGYSAAPTESGDSETAADPGSDLGLNVATRARPSLGGRASVSETDAQVPTSAAPVDYTELDVPGADLSDDVEPFVVESTPAQVAEAKKFFAAAKAAESSEQVKRARGQSRVFSVMQYREHPETGEVMLTQEQIDEGLAALGPRLHRWAYVWHPHDRLVEVDEGTGETVCCGIKGLHVHMVLWVADADGPRPTIRAVSDAFSIPSARVKPPKETAKQDGTEHKGRGAAEKAFFDLAEYLPHESRGKNAVPGIHQSGRHYLVDRTQEGMPGKYQYGRGRIVANFDFGRELDAHMAMRRNAAEGGGGAKLSKLFQAVGTGSLTLKQVREQEPAVYFAKGNLAHLQKLRQDFMLHQPAPRHRTNYYIGSPAGAIRKGRTGKTQLAKLFARMLYPDLDAEECYHVATDARVPLQNYKGQLVIIWDDYSVPGLLAALGSREGVWQVFDDHPSASDANVKYGSVRLVHAVNIIAKTTPYAEYLDGLAGKYTDVSGNVHEAEDRNQSWGRFPVVFEVTPDSIEMLVNRGFVDDSDDFLAFQKVARMRASMKAVCSGLDAIESDEEREAATFQVGEVLLRPIIDQHHALQPVADRAGVDVVGEILGSVKVLTGDDLAAFEAEAARKRANEHEMAMRARAAHELKPDARRHFEEAHLDGLNTPDPLVTPWDTSIAYSPSGELHCHFCPPDDDSRVSVAEAEEARRQANGREATMRERAACNLEAGALRHFEEAHLDGLNTPDPMLTPWGPPIAYSSTGELVCQFCRSAADSTDPTA